MVTNRVQILTDEVFPGPLTHSVLWDHLAATREANLPYLTNLSLLQALESLYANLQAPIRSSNRGETPPLKLARTSQRFNRTIPSSEEESD